mmetsp:Transcript_9100/g.55421  ORF Transcript_9100/g.55421 Transcript_9100/m.55421 type:complete len:451 (-) Transcript_9100:251-1603(-)
MHVGSCHQPTLTRKARCVPRRGRNASKKTRARSVGVQGNEKERMAFVESAFCRWLVEKGVAWKDQRDGWDVPSVYIASFRSEKKQGIRGLAAGTKCVAGDVILAVPETCRFPTDQRLQAADLPDDVHWGCRFALALLQEIEQGEDGRFWNYLQSLPEVMHAPPDFSWDVLQQIQYLPVYDEISTYQHLVSQGYKQLQGAMPAETSLERWRWANAICHSRTFKLGTRRAMLPLADLINHSFNLQNVDWRLGTQGQVEIVALRNIAEHEQLYFSYGEKGSDHYFVFYGFVPDRNGFEDVVLFECIEDAVAWYLDNFAGNLTSEKRGMAWDNGIEGARGSAAYVPETESAARLLATVSGEVDTRMLGAFQSLHASTQGPDALECLYARCQELLRCFPTTLDADVQTLRDEELIEEMRLVLQYRASKKHLLVGLLGLVQEELDGNVGFLESPFP